MSDELEEDYEPHDVYADDWNEETPRDEVILFEDDEDRKKDNLPRNDIGRVTVTGDLSTDSKKNTTWDYDFE